MNIVFEFNSAWYILFIAFLISWIILMTIRRRSDNRREIKEQVFLALSGLSTLVLMEFFAVSFNLWSYTPGNWPLILWPTYLAAILFGYQLLRSIESLVHRYPILPKPK
jgi:phosphatidylglycerophosphate synthase